MKKINIVAPLGGFGNYIRWIILLDDQFSNNIKAIKDSYENLAGSSWPNYNDFLNDRYLETPVNIIDEIKSRCEIKFVSLTEKVKFIEQEVFPPSRTCSNWLEYEWKYRERLDKVIQFGHEYVDTNLTTLLITVDKHLAYSYYVKLNPNLFNITSIKFINTINEVNQHHILISKFNKNTHLMDSTILYQPTLDYNWYQQLISKFELSDNYQTANKIHNLWFSCHQRT